MTPDQHLSIPVCNLDHWKDRNHPKLRNEFLDNWDHAFRTYGFLILKNHGLEDKYRALYNELEEFFNLPTEKKLDFRLTESYGYGGYTPQGQESVSRTYLKSKERPPDAVESLVLSRETPESFPCRENGYGNDQLKNLALELQEQLDQLTLSVMEIMAECLGLPNKFFQDFYTSPGGTKDMRAAHYLPEGDPQTGRLRYGEHTDYTGFTFLWRSDDNGLQCLNPHQQESGAPEDWIDVSMTPDQRDALVINAGDLIQRWTNSYWISNVHRVAGPENRGQAAIGVRQAPISIVYFTGPAGATRVRVLSESNKVCASGDVLPEYKDEITAEEHLRRKLNASNE